MTEWSGNDIVWVVFSEGCLYGVFAHYSRAIERAHEMIEVEVDWDELEEDGVIEGLLDDGYMNFWNPNYDEHRRKKSYEVVEVSRMKVE